MVQEASDEKRSFRGLARAICSTSAAAIVLLVIEVAVSAYFVILLFGFCLSIAIGLSMFGLDRLAFHERPYLRGWSNSAATVGVLSIPLVGLVSLGVTAAVDFPSRGGGADLVLILALTIIVIEAGIWIVAMLHKAITDKARARP